MTSEKKYGLFIPKNIKKTGTSKIANVFGDDDEDDGENQDAGSKGISSKYGATANKKSVIKRQTQIDIDKALSEDPTVFEYDSVYDTMAGQKEDKKVKKAVETKPRYIEQLLKASEKRKQEDERRNERKIQKEREAEGEEFADKEVFVTSAYKKKMEERQAEEERERREAEMEAKLDVTKQKDLTGFYRFILNETTKDVKEEADSVKVKQEPPDEDIDKDDTKTAGKHMVKGPKKESPPQKSSKDQRKRRHSSSSSSDSSRSPSVRKQKETRKETTLEFEPASDSDNSDDQRPQRISDVSESHGSNARLEDKHSQSKDNRSKSKKARHSSDSDDEVEARPKVSKVQSRSQSNGAKEKDRDGRGPKTNNKAESNGAKARDADGRKTKTTSADRDLDADEDDSVDSDSSEEQQSSTTPREFVGPAPPSATGAEKTEKKEPVKSRYARRNTEEDVKAARSRYLARQLARERLRGAD